MEWLGRRQPELYGTKTAAELDVEIQAYAEARNVALQILYTNYEGEAISTLYQSTREGLEGVLMNPAGFLMEGAALRDCLKGIALPYVEVHMTNIEKRGRKSVLADVADAMITGFGHNSYALGMDALVELIAKKRSVGDN